MPLGRRLTSSPPHPIDRQAVVCGPTGSKHIINRSTIRRLPLCPFPPPTAHPYTPSNFTLYPKEDKDDRKLVYYCRSRRCDWTEEAPDPYVFRNQVVKTRTYVHAVQTRGRWILCGVVWCVGLMGTVP